MANAGLAGNCRQHSVHDRPRSAGDSGILGMNRKEYSPHAIYAVMCRRLICRQTLLVAYHRRVVVRQSAVWCSRIALVTINVVILHRARLVLGWVTFTSSNRVRTLSVLISHPGQLSLVIPPG